MFDSVDWKVLKRFKRVKRVGGERLAKLMDASEVVGRRELECVKIVCEVSSLVLKTTKMKCTDEYKWMDLVIGTNSGMKV